MCVCLPACVCLCVCVRVPVCMSVCVCALPSSSWSTLSDGSDPLRPRTSRLFFTFLETISSSVASPLSPCYTHTRTHAHTRTHTHREREFYLTRDIWSYHMVIHRNTHTHTHTHSHLILRSNQQLFKR